MEIGVDRQLAIFRAIVKDVFREKGIKLTGDGLREVNSEIEGLNKRHQFAPPLELSEILALYLELNKELADEHFANVQSRLAHELSRKAKK
jgi:hypothetical protein